MRVSVIATVLNEESSIAPLLDSLLTQTKRPDEIVVVDGGSSDKTAEIIENYQSKSRIVKLVIEKGTIAHGRNVAVEHSRNELIAQIDGGCVADKHWLARIVSPFSDKTVGVVAGFYEMIGENSFQKAVVAYHGIPARRYDPRSFLPSGRSMAFRKDVWRRVGGYSETLERAGEDTLFNYNVVRLGVKIARVRNAIVYWELPRSFRESVKKLYFYAKGDGQATIWWHPAQRLSTHSIKILSVFGRYAAATAVLFGTLASGIFMYIFIVMTACYMCWSIHKNEDVVTDFFPKLWLPLIQVSADVTVMVGFLSGLLTRVNQLPASAGLSN